MIATHLAACGLDSRFAAVALNDRGEKLWKCCLDYRAHDIPVDPARHICAVIGRKPGPRISVCDFRTGAVLRVLVPLPDCTFDGHGIFSAAGDQLYTTQSEGKGQRGAIGVYDVATGMLRRRFSTYGIEPHELLWLENGRNLVVGNGGIVDRNATDPIDSSLVCIDAANGDLIGKTVLEEDLETLSLRHLARLSDGRIVCGAQDQDPATDLRPLVFAMDRSGGATAFDLPRDIHRRLAGYIGSIAVDRSGEIVCATSPRGGLAVFWTKSGDYLGAAELADVCGVAAGSGPGQFLLTSGHGHRLLVTAASQAGISVATLSTADGVQWDNHLSSVAALV
ncbi:DUF1513 domain-containing protein [Dongia sp.]|uniref:DUF1513 domain-containing protein n=1 Tax=Dongia sp. TaxID=1977262 RepID=UPI0035B1B1FD